MGQLMLMMLPQNIDQYGTPLGSFSTKRSMLRRSHAQGDNGATTLSSKWFSIAHTLLKIVATIAGLLTIQM
ncbi:MAG TPA: hypothetical protein VK211_21785 [Kamptonema sp.]|nr:hypothetical protein [Kamptonema sp.]